MKHEKKVQANITKHPKRKGEIKDVTKENKDDDIDSILKDIGPQVYARLDVQPGSAIPSALQMACWDLVWWISEDHTKRFSKKGGKISR